MKFREAKQKDLDYVNDNSISRGVLDKQFESVDYCYVLEHEGNILGAGGFRLINSVTAWCWLDLTRHSQDHIIVCYRTIKEWIDIFVKEHELKRLQAYVRIGYDEGIRMVEHLGFKQEFVMKDFMPEGDAMMYRRLI
jgi:hypothetical protein